MVVFPHLERHLLLIGNTAQRLQNTMIARVNGDEALRLQRAQPARDLGIEASPVVIVVQGDVMNPHALPAQMVTEVAHGGKEQHQALAVLTHVAGLVGHLHHQHRVGVAVEIIEGA